MGLDKNTVLTSNKGRFRNKRRIWAMEYAGNKIANYYAAAFGLVAKTRNTDDLAEIFSVTAHIIHTYTDSKIRSGVYMGWTDIDHPGYVWEAMNNYGVDNMIKKYELLRAGKNDIDTSKPKPMEEDRVRTEIYFAKCVQYHYEMNEALVTD